MPGPTRARHEEAADQGGPAPGSGDGGRRSWREVAGVCLEPHNLRTTVSVALVVGTVLFAINQLNVVLAGQAGAGTAVKICLTYCVPFLVANYGILHATRRRRD